MEDFTEETRPIIETYIGLSYNMHVFLQSLYNPCRIIWYEVDRKYTKKYRGYHYNNIWGFEGNLHVQCQKEILD